MQQKMPGLVLATVIQTIGSTPQKPGSSAIFENGRVISGTVGGGVAENKVQEAADRCISSGKSRYLHLFLNNDISNKDEAICGGEIFILVDANPWNPFIRVQGVTKVSSKKENPESLLLWSHNVPEIMLM